MKNTFALILLLALASSVFWLAFRQTAPARQGPAGEAASFVQGGSSNNNNNGSTANAKPFPSLAERKRMSQDERLRWLEDLGQVPVEADTVDWQLAQKTSWWGKPLDPKVFWKGRTAWLDKAAESEARRHGRMFPPMPYDDPSLPHYKDDKDSGHSNLSEIEGPNIGYHGTARERAFWSKFVQTQPKPPEELESKQLEVATTILGERFELEHGGNPIRTTPARQAQMDEREKAQAVNVGFPREAFSDEALLMAYVLSARQEYQSLIDGGASPDSNRMNIFFHRLVVDPKSMLRSP